MCRVLVFPDMRPDRDVENLAGTSDVHVLWGLGRFVERLVALAEVCAPLDAPATAEWEAEVEAITSWREVGHSGPPDGHLGMTSGGMTSGGMTSGGMRAIWRLMWSRSASRVFSSAGWRWVGPTDTRYLAIIRCCSRTSPTGRGGHLRRAAPPVDRRPSPRRPDPQGGGLRHRYRPS